MTASQHPFVSILMPIHNDIETIVRALGSALDQNYPRDLLEVIAVDRGSVDETRDVAMRATYDKRMRLLDLPGTTAAAALEHALKAARGTIIVMLDGRSAIPLNYVAACVAALENPASDGVLGRITYSGTSRWTAASARATSFVLGSQPVAYRRTVVHDDQLPVSQAGVKYAHLPDEQVVTQPGPMSFGELWSFHFDRGFIAGKALKRDPRSARPGALFGGAIAVLVSASLLAPLVRPLRPTVVRIWRWYLLVLTFLALRAANSSAHTAKGRGNAPPPQPEDLLPYLPFALAAIHLSYGSGLLAGVFRRSRF